MRTALALLLSLFFAVPAAHAADEDAFPAAKDFGALQWRLIGPAMTGGRVSDLAVDPRNRAHYYVAVASGGVWETTNAGTTFEPIFDGEGSYSIGCLRLDPTNPLVLWVGTGENNSQRSVSYGDGVYKSVDGGRNFENVGLPESEHIGMITVDPRDGNVVYVAAQGPLWRAGGDRGLYKTTDGGKTWERILHIDDDTGVSEVWLDPRDPDVLYAISYQRRRHTWTLINGGPGSGIHKSLDGGASWTELTNGLPTVDMGRIGMAISANPDVIYTVVEAAGDASGTYVSTDAGANWEKRSSYLSNSPQYYQELVCHPHDPDVVYSMDTFLHRTVDGGRTWENIEGYYKHVDNHAMWIDPDDPDYLLTGCDGGVYESFDEAESWHFVPTIPITQFYKIAVDDEEPFYNVYGGTQDNFSLGAPARSTSANGIRAADWTITLGGDGFEPAVEPGNPDIVYSQWQYGNLHRFDRRTGENLDIQPQPEPGMPPLRWNWSSALLISPHNPQRLYYGSQILFRSDDRGQSWTAISGDLTRNLDRNQLEVMGRVWGVDTVAKNRSTSFFGTIVAFSESPLVPDLLYAGTDDGLVQISEDGGANWRKVDKFPGVPEMAYITALTASEHDPDVVYVSIDNHKQGDFTPYVLRSDDRGRSWKSIAGDLPERGQVWDIVEDHQESDLLFASTEFSVFASKDGGKRWIEIGAGLPPIACRDLEVVAREDDLVVGTFGRGIYVLDDYSPLRELDEADREQAAVLFAPQTALMFMESAPLGLPGKSMQGDDYWIAPNPPVAATISWWMKEGLQTREEKRQELEAELRGKGEPAFYPPWEELEAEDREVEPAVIVTVRDEEGHVVRRLSGPTGSGMHRVHWDFRYPDSEPVRLKPHVKTSPWSWDSFGPMAAPGRYTVELHARHDGKLRELAAPVGFDCVPLVQSTLPQADRRQLLAFQRETADMQRQVMGLSRELGQATERLEYLMKSVLETPGAELALQEELVQLGHQLEDVSEALNGDRTRSSRSEPVLPGLIGRVQRVVGGHWTSTSPATESAKMNIRVVREELPKVRAEFEAAASRLAEIRAQLDRMGGSWVP